METEYRIAAPFRKSETSLLCALPETRFAKRCRVQFWTLTMSKSRRAVGAVGMRRINPCDARAPTGTRNGRMVNCELRCEPGQGELGLIRLR